jgi:NADH dehydrogenase [ubiquinone] 1 alpha subcomplex assembly factor 2
VRVSPAWHQWLRHTRAEAPSLQEQQGDVVRQAQLKVLAAQADARWEAKARLVGGPAQGDGLGKVDAKLFGAAQPVTDPGEKDPRKDDMKGTEKAKPGDQEQEQVQDPGKRARGGPSEEWQPQAWNPASTTKR